MVDNDEAEKEILALSDNAKNFLSDILNNGYMNILYKVNKLGSKYEIKEAIRELEKKTKDLLS